METPYSKGSETWTVHALQERRLMQQLPPALPPTYNGHLLEGSHTQYGRSGADKHPASMFSLLTQRHLR